jgi:ABC-type sulfate transport system permease subunit
LLSICRRSLWLSDRGLVLTQERIGIDFGMESLFNEIFFRRERTLFLFKETAFEEFIESIAFILGSLLVLLSLLILLFSSLLDLGMNAGGDSDGSN